MRRDTQVNGISQYDPEPVKLVYSIFPEYRLEFTYPMVNTPPGSVEA
jgi:hypothetical protein